MDFSIDAIPMMSTIMAQGKIMDAVGVGMLSKTLDVANAEMSDLTKAMELSVNPDVGANFDVSV